MGSTFQYVWDRIRVRLKAMWFRAVNRCSTRSVLDSSGPVVSLTSHGARLDKAHIGIESIAQGDLRPSRLILWVDQPQALTHLSPGLKRLVKRGLEVVLTNNLGPHTKYYPSLALAELRSLPLVTADDDIMYPSTWLKGLWQAYQADASCIHCYRAHVVGLSETGEILPYAQWQPCRSTRPSYRHFLTGVSGVIYPPAMTEALRQAGQAFVPLCPKADDIWLHVMAIRAGFPVHQLQPDPLHFDTVPSTQHMSLMAQNVGLGANDRQAAATYTPSDRQIMLRA